MVISQPADKRDKSPVDDDTKADNNRTCSSVEIQIRLSDNIPDSSRPIDTLPPPPPPASIDGLIKGPRVIDERRKQIGFHVYADHISAD